MLTASKSDSQLIPTLNKFSKNNFKNSLLFWSYKFKLMPSFWQEDWSSFHVQFSQVLFICIHFTEARKSKGYKIFPQKPIFVNITIYKYFCIIWTYSLSHLGSVPFILFWFDRKVWVKLNVIYFWIISSCFYLNWRFLFAINNSGINDNHSMCQIGYSLTLSRFYLVVDIEVIADMID